MKLYDGRMTRMNYFLVNIILFIIMCMAITTIAISVNLYIICFIALCIVWSVAVVRRCHDSDMSGWHGLLFLVPIANLFIGLGLLLGDGTIGPNKYGEDPKHRIPVVESCPHCGEKLEKEI